MSPDQREEPGEKKDGDTPSKGRVERSKEEAEASAAEGRNPFQIKSLKAERDRSGDHSGG